MDDTRNCRARFDARRDGFEWIGIRSRGRLPSNLSRQETIGGTATFSKSRADSFVIDSLSISPFLPNGILQIERARLVRVAGLAIGKLGGPFKHRFEAGIRKS